MPKKPSPPKIAIVHDHLGFRGGGERTMFVLAFALKADFITAYAYPETYSGYQKKLGKKLLILSQKIVKKRVIRFFWLRHLFRKNRRLLQKYDILIASGQTATEVVAKYARPESTRIVYTHTPPRRVFDQYENSKKMYPWFLQPAYALFAAYWKVKYLNAVRKFDINIANSKNVRERIRLYTGSDANAVIWPPIQTKRFKWISQKNYFLSWARIDEAKRVELVARAFAHMPDQNLIVASGGPRQKIVRQIAAENSNIHMAGWVTDEELAELVGNCRAAVYIPIDEDAGMTHLEANAAGKPILGVNEGGLRESVVEGQTGILIPRHPIEKDIQKAVAQMTPEWCLERRKICADHAQKYDEKIFADKMTKIVMDNNPQIPVLGIDASRWEDPRLPGQDKRTGVENYSRNIIRHLISLAEKKGLRIRIYTPRTIRDLPAEIQKVIPGKKRWTQKYLARELRSSPPNYFFTPSYYIPDNSPPKSFAVLHDVTYRTHPRLFSWSERLRQELAAYANLRRSHRVITISEFSRKEISREYRVDPNRIVVSPIGHKPQENLKRDRAREKFILYIGRIEKKKSVDTLVHAFAKFRQEHSGWQLILAGNFGHGIDEIRQLIKELRLQDSVSLPGYIDEKQKWDLLTRASVFCHPSTQEGSCLPLLEAWDSHTPSIIANISVMHEIAADGALYFQPQNQADLAKKLQELTANQNLQKELIQKGATYLKKMSWDRSARIILKTILGK